MKLLGIAKIMNVTEKSEKVATCDLYFSTQVSKKDGSKEYETDFIKGRLVGKAKQSLDELADVMDIEKLTIELTNSLMRCKSYKDKKGEFKVWNEVTIFEFEIPQPKETQPKKSYGGKKYSKKEN